MIHQQSTYAGRLPLTDVETSLGNGTLSRGLLFLEWFNHTQTEANIYYAHDPTRRELELFHCA